MRKNKTIIAKQVDGSLTIFLGAVAMLEESDQPAKRKKYTSRSEKAFLNEGCYITATWFADLFEDFYNYIFSRKAIFIERIESIYSSLRGKNFSKFAFLGRARECLDATLKTVYGTRKELKLSQISRAFPDVNPGRIACLCILFLLSTRVLAEKRDFPTAKQKIWQQIYELAAAELPERKSPLL